MNTRSILSAVSSIVIASLNTACGDQDPKQLVTEKSWDLVAWSDKGKITKYMDHLPTIHFKDDQVVGNGGINGFGGAYQAKDDGSLIMEGISITEMGGPREILKMESTYMDILWKCKQWSIVDDTLILSDGTEKNQLRYKTGIRKIDRPLKNQKWELTGVQVINENSMTLTAMGQGRITLKIGDGDTVSGSSGVNSYSGKVKIEDKNGISFGPMRMTKKSGPPEAMKDEQLYLQKLSKVTQWEIKGRQLVLSDENKTFGLVFDTE